MPLSSSEISALTEKLRIRYSEAAKKFSPKWFDLTAFENRLDMARRKKMDLEAFILAEIANFEKTRDRYDKKKKEKGAFTRKVDDIIEENLARIRKYPAIDFHPSAGPEIKHLYGALAELSQGYIPVFWLILDTPYAKNSVSQIEYALQQSAVPRGAKLPPAIEDHVLLINRRGVTELEIEKARSNYLKESAFLLYGIMDFCDAFLTGRTSPILETPVRFDKAHFNPASKKLVVFLFSDCTGYGALMKIKGRCEEILTDFRLTAFRPADTSRFTLRA
jgi:hypothetical protein